LAEQLLAEGVPMLFLTGMGCGDVPEELADVPCVAKPIIAARVVDELAALIGPVTAAA
jgi:hypothetical protein